MRPGGHVQQFVALNEALVLDAVTVAGTPQSDQRQQTVVAHLVLDQRQIEVRGGGPPVVGRHAEHVVHLARPNELQQGGQLRAQRGRVTGGVGGDARCGCG